MRDQLLDIVKAITVVPFEVVKVTGVDGDVTIQSRLLQDDTNGAVIFRGKLSKPLPEFEGVFGLSGIATLSSFVNLEAIKDKDSKISVKRLERTGVSIPEEIVFEKEGFGKLSYRLTAEKAIPPQIKEVKSINWNVVIEQPSQKKIMELAQVGSALANQETKFSVKTENRQLKFLIGDESAATSKAQFVFAEGITGNLKPNHTWNLSGILNVLKLSTKGDTTMRICEEGVLQIEIDTGIGVYTYMFAGSN